MINGRKLPQAWKILQGKGESDREIGQQSQREQGKGKVLKESATAIPMWVVKKKGTM